MRRGGLSDLLWESTPYERLPARLAGGSVAVIFCVGLVLKQPWLSQISALVALLPMSLWLLWQTGVPRARDGGSATRYWTLLIGLALYLAALWLSTALAGQESEHSLPTRAWTVMLCIATIASIGLTHRYDRGVVRYLGRWLSLATIAAAVMVVVGAIATGAFAQGRLHGVFGLNWVLNPNALAGVFAICFAVMVGHGTSQRISEQERAAVLIGSLLPLAVVLLTQSRGAMLGCAAGALVACLVAFPGWVQLLLMRGDSSRLAIWVHFLELARAKPWLGYGLDYDVTYKLGAGTIHTPHNILIAALVRGGVLGLLPLVVTLATAILAAVTAARRQWWLPLIVLTTALALSSVDHELLPTQFGFYWYLFWLPLGLAAAAALAPCDLAASETSAGSVEGQAVPSDRMRSTVAPSPVR
jgi:hypothetical protein